MIHSRSGKIIPKKLKNRRNRGKELSPRNKVSLFNPTWRKFSKRTANPTQISTDVEVRNQTPRDSRKKRMPGNQLIQAMETKIGALDSFMGQPEYWRNHGEKGTALRKIFSCAGGIES